MLLMVVPKVKTLAYIKDFRPISLCNVTYKMVSKVIVNRLCAFMPSIIHDRQSAFVENGLITNNIIVTFKAFHSMEKGRINGFKHFSLKLDLS